MTRDMIEGERYLDYNKKTLGITWLSIRTTRGRRSNSVKSPSPSST